MRVESVMRFFSRLALLAIALFVSNTSVAADSSGPKIRITAAIPSIDWQATLDLASARVILNIMQGLTAFDGNDKLVPALAESWTSSKDSTTFTFKLRNGVVWSDGVALTSQHFVDAFRRLLDPKTGALGASFVWMIKGARSYTKGQTSDPNSVGVRAVDSSTLEFKLERPCVFWPAVLAHTVALPIRLDKIKEFGDKKWALPQNVVGLGPYRIASWKEDEYALVANEKYFGASPRTPAFSFKVVHDDSTALNLYRSGRLDVLYNPPRMEWAELRNEPGFQVFSNIRVAAMAFNLKKPPFDNPKVRQAFALASDRDSIVKVLDVGKKSGQEAIYRRLDSWIPAGMPAHNPQLGLKYNPELAKKRLAEAGYPGGKGFPIVKIGVNSRDEDKLMGERLQAEWRKILGVQVDLDVKEPMDHLARLRTDPPAVFRFGIGAVYLEPDLFMNLFTEEAGLNFGGWTNTEYASLSQKAGGESNSKKAQGLYDRAQRILLEENPALIPIEQEALPVMVSSSLKDFRVNCQGVPQMRVAQFSITKAP